MRCYKRFEKSDLNIGKNKKLAAQEVAGKAIPAFR